MDEPKDATTPPHGFTRTDLIYVLLLAVSVIGIRAWQLTHTVVAARDSIGYIRIAWRLEHGDWTKVIPQAAQHPLYPATVLFTSWPVRRLLPDDLPQAMQISAQLASAIASVLLVLPMYLLGRELFSRRISFGATLLFQCLPAAGRVLGDGLSEAVFLLFAAWALYLASYGFRSRSILPFALSGLASGLAYLTRPEGLLIAAATGLVLLSSQAVSRWRRPWSNFVLCGAVLTIATLIVSGPYMVLIRGLTVKQAANRVGNHLITQTIEQPDLRLASLGFDLPLLAEWSDPNPDIHAPSERRMWGFIAIGEVLVRGFFWSSWLPALVGLWVYRDRFRLMPVAQVALILCGIIAVLLYGVAVVVGYLSDRHTLLIILFGCYWAVAGMQTIGGWLAGITSRLFPGWRETRWTNGMVWTTGLLTVLCVGPLIRTLEPLHADRAGYRAAGQWLAEHAWTGDEIDDPYAWANYYAGHVFTEVDHDAGLPFTPGPAHTPRVLYVVLEKSDNKHPRLNKKYLEDLVKQRKPNQHWPLSNRKDHAEVAVYVVPQEEKQN